MPNTKVRCEQHHLCLKNESVGTASIIPLDAVESAKSHHGHFIMGNWHFPCLSVGSSTRMKAHLAIGRARVRPIQEVVVDA